MSKFLYKEYIIKNKDSKVHNNNTKIKSYVQT